MKIMLLVLLITTHCPHSLYHHDNEVASYRFTSLGQPTDVALRGSNNEKYFFSPHDGSNPCIAKKSDSCTLHLIHKPSTHIWHILFECHYQSNSFISLLSHYYYFLFYCNNIDIAKPI